MNKTESNIYKTNSNIILKTPIIDSNNHGTNDHFTTVSCGIWTMSHKVTKSISYKPTTLRFIPSILLRQKY